MALADVHAQSAALTSSASRVSWPASLRAKTLSVRTPPSGSPGVVVERNPTGRDEGEEGGRLLRRRAHQDDHRIDRSVTASVTGWPCSRSTSEAPAAARQRGCGRLRWRSRWPRLVRRAAPRTRRRPRLRHYEHPLPGAHRRVLDDRLPRGETAGGERRGVREGDGCRRRREQLSADDRVLGGSTLGRHRQERDDILTDEAGRRPSPTATTVPLRSMPGHMRKIHGEDLGEVSRPDCGVDLVEGRAGDTDEGIAGPRLRPRSRRPRGPRDRRTGRTGWRACLCFLVFLSSIQAARRG